VALQVVVLGLLAVAGVAGWGGWGPAYGGVLAYLGALVMAAGVVVAVLAVAGLGPSLTALPAPVAHGRLRTEGPYSLVRHPIYSGLLLLALGWSMVTTPWCLLLVAALGVVLDLKRRVEERWLRAAYPEYPMYEAVVRHALVPYLW
jgi:protein-S-isoprenylcysteine O-methyltransferase Ste14